MMNNYKGVDLEEFNNSFKKYHNSIKQEKNDFKNE